MEKRIKRRIAMALKCKPEEVPEDPEKLRDALKDRRAELKKGVKHG